MFGCEWYLKGVYWIRVVCEILEVIIRKYNIKYLYRIKDLSNIMINDKDY